MMNSHLCYGLLFLVLSYSTSLSPTVIAQDFTKSDSVGSTGSQEEPKPPIVLGTDTIATHDVNYVGGNDSHQTLDIYAPKNASSAPVFVFIHGGGWLRRDKDEVGSQPKLFNSAGIIVVSINYRLAPAVQHPENAKDVAAAIAWIDQNIEKYGGNPNQIILMGHSAGSHLAALVSTDDRYLAAHGLHLDDLAGVVSVDGSAFDIPERIAKGAEKLAENCRRVFGESQANQIDGSPVTHIKGERKLPPFLLIFLKEDSLNHTQSKRFSELVREFGGAAELMHIPDGKTHQELCDHLGTESDHAGPLLVDFVKSVID